MTVKPVSRFASTDPGDVAWRVRHIDASNAIEGVERDPLLGSYVDRMDAEGVPIEEQIKRIIAFDPKAGRTADE